MPTLRLTYFDAAGRAEPIRVALNIAGLPFEDHRLRFPEFMALKQDGAFPLGSVPVLEVDGVPIPQTAAILRYVARLGQTDLYPSDPGQALIVDSVLDTFNDTLSNAMAPSFSERDMDKKLQMRAELATGAMMLAFRFVERLLESSEGPFLLGESLSIADLVLASQLLQIRAGKLDGITEDYLGPYPRMQALADAYLAEPRVAAYLAARG